MFNNTRGGFRAWTYEKANWFPLKLSNDSDLYLTTSGIIIRVFYNHHDEIYDAIVAITEQEVERTVNAKRTEQ